jgi:hypothetical protein
LADAGAGSTVHDKAGSLSEVIPFEVVAEPIKPEPDEAALASVTIAKKRDENASEVSASMESSEVGIPELKPLPPEGPGETAARGDDAAAESKSDIGKGQAELAKTGEEKSSKEAKEDESKPDAMKTGDAGLHAVKDAGSKADVVQDVNAVTASSGIEGEEETAKSGHPFNRILRRFFTPAGK